MKNDNQNESEVSNYQNSEEIQEIINEVPSWIVQWGITIIFIVIFLFVVLSSIIRYPELIKVNVKVNSLNSPKNVFAKEDGKLMKIFVKDGMNVEADQVLAFLESNGNPYDVLALKKTLVDLQDNILNSKSLETVNIPNGLNLGELQLDYQVFHHEYLNFVSTLDNGFHIRQLNYLKKDLLDIQSLRTQVNKQIATQKKEFENIQDEYQAYKGLYVKKVISKSEFMEKENKYLNAKNAYEKTESLLLDNFMDYGAKQKEIAGLMNDISEKKALFSQALSQCINKCEDWIRRFVIKASIKGKLSYSGIIQQNQNVFANQELFIINPGNTNFFGEAQIPQYNMGKISVGQQTFIKLKSYPFEQYGMIRGKITYISDVAFRDTLFIAKLSFDRVENIDSKNKIVLKNNMMADGEIVVDEMSLMGRFLRNITRGLSRY